MAEKMASKMAKHMTPSQIEQKLMKKGLPVKSQKDITEIIVIIIVN